MPGGHGESGEMPEWSIGAVSKTVVRATGPRVRIPLSPQSKALPSAKSGRDFCFTATRVRLAGASGDVK